MTENKVVFCFGFWHPPMCSYYCSISCWTVEQWAFLAGILPRFKYHVCIMQHSFFMVRNVQYVYKLFIIIHSQLSQWCIHLRLIFFCYGQTGLVKSWLVNLGVYEFTSQSQVMICISLYVHRFRLLYVWIISVELNSKALDNRHYVIQAVKILFCCSSSYLFVYCTKKT